MRQDYANGYQDSRSRLNFFSKQNQFFVYMFYNVCRNTENKYNC